MAVGIMSDNAKKVEAYKTTISSIADTFVCPITMEYPFRPVIAEDGRVYEEAALKEWMEKDECREGLRGVNTGGLTAAEARALTEARSSRLRVCVGLRLG